MKFRQYILILCLCALCACGGGTNTPTNEKGDKAMHRSTKRGVAFSFTRTDDAMLLSPAISWWYNWGPDCTAEGVNNLFALDSVVFLPMAWNTGFNVERIRNYVKAHPSCKYILAYNEPNLTDQANMIPQRAAENWPQLKALATELNLKIVSPAMNYGTLSGYHDPIKWLDEFFACEGVSLNDVDAIAIHCYMASPSAFKDYVGRFEKYGKPIWMTEFCAWDPVPGSVETQLNYMCDVINWMEQTSLVERYAWFIPRSSGKVDSAPYMQLLTHSTPSELTEAGRVFTSLSTFDKTVWLDCSKPLSAINYVGLSHDAIQIRSNTDTDKGLMVKDIREGQWLEYQLFLPEGVTQIALRYATVLNSTALIFEGTQLIAVAELPKTGSMTDWATASAPISVKAGKHTIRFQVGSGAFHLNWIQMQ